MQELIGDTLGGQYQIEAKVGQGGMAEVFRAYQLSLGRHVAIKILPPSFANQDPDFKIRFEREAKAIANLTHPNILPVYDFGVDRDYSYIVMRYVEGGQTLAHLMRHPLTSERAVHLIGQVADALAYAHDRGIIHRDVKPGNILLDKDWALLSDFGLAKVQQDASRLTGTGRGIGTAAYMSPEQSQGNDIDHRTDIYALGVILYQMLTGHIPHDADNPVAIMMQRLTQPPPSPRQYNDSISEQIEQIILRALSTERDYRYDSATDFATVLKTVITNGSGELYQPAQDSKVYATNVFSTQLLFEPQKEALSTKVLASNGGSASVPPAAVNTPVKLNRWATILSSPLVIVGTVIFLMAILFVAFFIIRDSEANEASFSIARLVPTATETLTATPTFTFTPTHILKETEEPTQEFVLRFLPTSRATATPSLTPIPPTSTPTVTPSLTATFTPSPVIISAESSSASEQNTTADTLDISGNKFVLLGPADLNLPSYGPTIFEWEWDGSLSQDLGFEIRVWQEGEIPLGAHNSVHDNQSGQVKYIGENRYQLETNIRDAAGVRDRSGEYFWQVALVRIAPHYEDLGVQSSAKLFRFEGNSGGSSDGPDEPVRRPIFD